MTETTLGYWPAWAKDVLGLAKFPNGMDSTSATEISDASEMLRTYRNLCKSNQVAANTGGEVTRWANRIRASERLITTLDDRVKLYTGLVQQLREDEARERNENSPPDEDEETGFDMVDPR